MRMGLRVLGFLLFFSICFAETEEYTFDPSQDPNMVKTAPQKQGRTPAQAGEGNAYSNSTEAKTCYGFNCSENNINSKPQVFQIDTPLLQNTNPQEDL